MPRPPSRNLMRRLPISTLTLAGFCAVAGAQVPAAPAPSVPVIGVIDFYGRNKVTEDRIRKTLAVKEGDPFPPSKAAMEERLDALPGVVESHLEAVCCDGSRIVLYVGIEERGAAHFAIREPPASETALPEDVVALYRRFSDAFEDAVRSGSIAEDLTQGHSLMADPLVREIQQQFPAIADQHLSELRNVLRNSADYEQRAMAAYILGYASKKDQVSGDLQFALRDADPGVRANAARALVAVAVYARLHPDAGVKLEPTWFIEMLNSLSWSDRQRALSALEILTDSRDPQVLGQLRQRALPALAEMSRWKTLEHALPAFVLTGRVAGLAEQQIQDAWTRGDRESVIAAATGKKTR